MKSIAERYLSLLKKSLLNQLYLENEARLILLLHYLGTGQPMQIETIVAEYLGIREQHAFKVIEEGRKIGAWIPFCNADGSECMAVRNFTFLAHTMIGQARMDNLHQCLNTINAEKIPGDLIETGVWRGGATVFMRGFLAAHGIKKRKVWVADSFAGVPKASYKQDQQEMDYSAEALPFLAVSQKEVEELFARYELLDGKVKFLKGWFKDTLPQAPIRKLALMRLDGDLYESTMDALTNLYHKLSPGGYVIVDDYLALEACKAAVDEFRFHHGIVESIKEIDDVSIFWRKSC